MPPRHFWIAQLVIILLITATSIVQDRLRIIWTPTGDTPHAIAALGCLPQPLVSAVRHAFMLEIQTGYGRDPLRGLRIKEWVAASDSGWNDIRELNFDALK